METDRRRLLRGMVASAAALFLSGCDRLSQAPWWRDILGRAEELTMAAQRSLIGADKLAQEFPESMISKAFRANGSTDPDDTSYRAHTANGFADWRLKVGGLVERPMSFSLAELRAMPSRTQITRHDCVEGWSAIGKWTGVPLAEIVNRVRPKGEARYLVFHCADTMERSLAGDVKYYESIDFIDAMHPQTILAYAMNDATLPVAYGAPLRLRVERQLGYKMAKYVMSIEAVSSLDKIGGGKGGYWEDRGYDWYAGI